MSLAEFLASVPRFPEMPGAREALARQQAVEQRALRIREALPMSPETARRVAEFSLGGWAQNLPDYPRDIGERAALYIVEWLIVRNVNDTEDMRTALGEWQAHELVEWFDASRERQRANAADVVRTLARMAKDAAIAAPRVANHLARRAPDSRRRSK